MTTDTYSGSPVAYAESWRFLSACRRRTRAILLPTAALYHPRPLRKGQGIVWQHISGLPAHRERRARSEPRAYSSLRAEDALYNAS